MNGEDEFGKYWQADFDEGDNFYKNAHKRTWEVAFAIGREQERIECEAKGYLMWPNHYAAREEGRKAGIDSVNSLPHRAMFDEGYARGMIEGRKSGLEEAAEIVNSSDGANGRSRDAIIFHILQRIEEIK